ncbi:MAG: MMPL family transporter, partial [Bacteroidetes bacterium]|nr:MMPL family transporter [Bacteroidota bacterium]
WTFMVRIILRNRLLNLIIIGVLTLIMLYFALHVKLSYEFSRMLPDSDSTAIEYEIFKQRFGEDGSVMFIGIQDNDLFTFDKFNAWYDLTQNISKIEGVEGVLSVARMFNLVKNDSLGTMDFKPVVTKRPASVEEVDSIKKAIFSLPFYKDFLYNEESGVHLLMVTLDKNVLNSKNRTVLMKEIKSEADSFGEQYNLELHYSGLPYIRIVTAKTLEDELFFFTYLAAIIAAVILFIFFRSFRAVAFPALIMGMVVVWVLGSISLFNYRITMLTGILPPLMIVIVVENCIFLLNKYHSEYLTHKNKIKALSRVVQRIGNANLLTNATTAAGFAAFTITGNRILTEFGIIASLNILVAYLLTLILIPIFFSYLPPPKDKHFKHLEDGIVSRIIGRIVNIVLRYRNPIYVIAIIFIALAIWGVTKLQTTGNIVDDISKGHKLYKDLMFLEENFKGVMPLEISVDSKEENGLFSDNAEALYKIKRFQRVFSKDTLYSKYFSRPLSIVDGISFIYQAHMGGDPKYYILPPPTKLNELKLYTGSTSTNNTFHSFIDSTNRITRISIQMANIGTREIEALTDSLRPVINEIFPPSDYDVEMTGTSVVYLKGTDYMVKNLFSSLLLALAIISVLMALLFTSFRMIIISLIPNLIPLIMTAGMMGFAGISIKPSTILIFSIALGISVDNAIHYLSRYRLQLQLNNWNIKESVLAALKETGFSMIYSSVVLFFGFSIFILSSFGGTEALGYLICFTLLVALASNLFILPSLLLTMDKYITTKTFKEPLLEIFDEEEDIELKELEIEKGE